MVVVATVLGDLTSAQMRLIGELAAAYGDGTVRITADQNLVFRWVRSRDVEALYRSLHAAGLSRGGAGTVADVTSCPGAESCKLAVTQSRGLGRLLGDRLHERPDLVAAVPGLDIKISGCPNGCGQHHIAGHRLPGQPAQGRRPAGAALLRHGRRRRRRRVDDVRPSRGDDSGAALRRGARAADRPLPGGAHGGGVAGGVLPPRRRRARSRRAWPASTRSTRRRPAKTTSSTSPRITPSGPTCRKANAARDRHADTCHSVDVGARSDRAHAAAASRSLSCRSATNVEIYAKAEFLNPGGSVKDRAAAAILADGERSGRLHAGVTILDATSGNTGIAYAMIAAARGYKLKLCVPDNVTTERKRTLRAYGAELVLTSPMEGSDGAIREARRLYESSPDRYFYADQYNNDANWRAHYDTTAVGDPGADRRPPDALRRRPRHQRHLHRRRPPAARAPPRHPADLGAARFAAARRRGPEAHGDGDPAGHLRSARWPTRTCACRPSASHDLTRRLAKEEGILAGVSSGAALAACLDLAARHPRGRDRDGVSRQRDALSDRAILGRAGLMSAGVGTGTSDHGRRARGDPARTASGPFRTSAAARSSRRRRDRRRLRAAEHHDQRRGAAIPDRPGRLPGRRRRAPRELKGSARRFLSFASEPSGPALAARPRAGVAEFQLRDYFGQRGRPRRHHLLAALKDDRSAFEQGELICHTES